MTRKHLLRFKDAQMLDQVLNSAPVRMKLSAGITITFSVEDPRDGTYWMPANAGEPCYFVGRYYEPDLNNIPGRPCD